MICSVLDCEEVGNEVRGRAYSGDGRRHLVALVLCSFHLELLRRRYVEVLGRTDDEADDRIYVRWRTP